MKVFKVVLFLISGLTVHLSSFNAIVSFNNNLPNPISIEIYTSPDQKHIFNIEPGTARNFYSDILSYEFGAGYSVSSDGPKKTKDSKGLALLKAPAGFRFFDISDKLLSSDIGVRAIIRTVSKKPKNSGLFTLEPNTGFRIIPASSDECKKSQKKELLKEDFCLIPDPDIESYVKYQNAMTTIPINE